MCHFVCSVAYGPRNAKFCCELKCSDIFEFSSVQFIPVALCSVAVPARKIWGTRPHDERGGLETEPQRGPGAEPLIRMLEGEAPWSWSTFGLWTFNRSRKLPTFLQFVNTKKSDRPICVIFAKNNGWPRNWGNENFPTKEIFGQCSDSPKFEPVNPHALATMPLTLKYFISDLSRCTHFEAVVWLLFR